MHYKYIIIVFNECIFLYLGIKHNKRDRSDSQNDLFFTSLVPQPPAVPGRQILAQQSFSQQLIEPQPHPQPQHQHQSSRGLNSSQLLLNTSQTPIKSIVKQIVPAANLPRAKALYNYDGKEQWYIRLNSLLLYPIFDCIDKPAGYALIACYTLCA